MIVLTSIDVVREGFQSRKTKKLIS